MKKRVVAIALSLAFAFGLCFAMAGCGNDRANFVGEWELESIESDTLGSIDATTLQSMEYAGSLTVNEDGSAALVLFGSSIDCTWEQNGAATMTVSIAGEGQAIFVLNMDGKLTSDDGDTTLTFVRADAAV